MQEDLLIGVGTYDGALICLSFNPHSSTPECQQLFCDNEAHPGAVSRVSVSQRGLHRLVASSSLQNSEVHVYSADRLKQLCALTSHEEGIGDVYFHTDGVHVLTAGEDGQVIIWRLDTSEGGGVKWEAARAMHSRHHVPSSLAVHPSGKLALSIDKKAASLRVWNLVRGRTQFGMRLQEPKGMRVMRFSATGLRFLVMGDTQVHIYGTADAQVEHVLRYESSAPSDACFITDSLLCVSHGRNIDFFSLDLQTDTDKAEKKKKKQQESTGDKEQTSGPIRVAQLQVDEVRVKVLAYVPSYLATSTSEESTESSGLLLVASTSTELSRVQGFHVDPTTLTKEGAAEPPRVLEYSIHGHRVTCLGAAIHRYVKLPKLAVDQKQALSIARQQQQANSNSAPPSSVHSGDLSDDDDNQSWQSSSESEVADGTSDQGSQSGDEEDALPTDEIVAGDEPALKRQKLSG